MSAPAVGGDRPTLRIRGTDYPVLLPTLRDPRLHLAAIIVTLQVLGQVAFDFQLSIAQILISLAVAGLLEVAIAFKSQHVLMWPASALLTGNGVAFVLRVPGTEHGDWWSTNGWWIFAGTSAVALLSKYVIRVRGRHVFNPSNFGLVLCFLLLGAERADPLALWWGPLSPALVVALALIVVGGFLILRRLHLVGIAVGFWLAFAAGIGVLAASGHTMTAAWHVGTIEGWEFWRLLVTSPEILVFLFFMITDPKTIPSSAGARRAYAVGVGLLATILIAPQTTEFATKVAILAALALVCGVHGLILLAGTSRFAAVGELRPTRRTVGAAALTGAIVYGALVFAAGIPARPDAGSARAAVADAGALPEITVAESSGVAGIDGQVAQTIARDVLVDLRAEADALRARDLEAAGQAASGAWLASLWEQIRSAAGGPIAVPSYEVARMELSLRPGEYQRPPTVVAELSGTVVVATLGRRTRDVVARAEATPFRRTLDLVPEGQRYLIVSSSGGVAAGGKAPVPPTGGALGGTRFDDVAAEVGLTFRHGAFRSGISTDTTAMMGGGLCWLDYDRDGWLDLFVVNSYADVDIGPSESRGGLPRSALYRNVGGRFEDVSARSGADLPLRGNGCVAADLNLDGNTDLFVTSAGYNVPTDGYHALLWNDGDGTFTEGAARAGITGKGWHSAAAVGDVDGNGRPDIFVTAYADPNVRVESSAGFPSNHLPLRDLLYLNVGTDGDGRSVFREAAKAAGVERNLVGHGLGAVFTDVDRDGRLDLYVANDTDANQLYRNVGTSGGLGFRFEEVARKLRVDDPNAGMGIAAADVDRDGRVDLFVTNSRGQLHAAYRSGDSPGTRYADARPDIAAVVGTRSTAWGDSWADLDLDGDLDLALANGGIPVVDLAKDAQRIQVLENVSTHSGAPRFTRVAGSGLPRIRAVNGRGLATADFDNDGDLDIAVNSIGGRLLLLENRTRRNHWLEVRFRTFAPGALVTAVLPDGRRLVREVLAGSSYLSSEDPRVHFGLGKASRVERLTVWFPDGSTTQLRDVAVDGLVEVGPP
ncbi:MAG TPA: FG-GAP-like repeat-containing protein [Gaiellaceae bacterium]|nr:FG-GAP-like repeat-containing protein [Gaiellaceae bacterium]